MVIAAIGLVGTEILALGVVGQKAWATVYFTAPKPDALQIQAQAGQFAFYFRYPGADGKFGGIHPDKIDEGNQNYFGLDPANEVEARDDIVSGELVNSGQSRSAAPDACQRCRSFLLCSGELRIQQDFVPGLDLAVHFTGHESWQVRNRLHPVVRLGSLQHEGLSERNDSGKTTRQMDEGARRGGPVEV